VLHRRSAGPDPVAFRTHLTHDNVPYQAHGACPQRVMWLTGPGSGEWQSSFLPGFSGGAPGKVVTHVRSGRANDLLRESASLRHSRRKIISISNIP
jgi:hypothetical protein